MNSKSCRTLATPLVTPRALRRQRQPGQNRPEDRDLKRGFPKGSTRSEMTRAARNDQATPSPAVSGSIPVSGVIGRLPRRTSLVGDACDPVIFSITMIGARPFACRTHRLGADAEHHTRDGVCSPDSRFARVPRKGLPRDALATFLPEFPFEESYRFVTVHLCVPRFVTRGFLRVEPLKACFDQESAQIALSC
jgi:hypothetical protein